MQAVAQWRAAGMASRELRATQGSEEEVGSLTRAYARFAPNFGPGPVGDGAIRAEDGPRTTSEAPLSSDTNSVRALMGVQCAP
jgi:hypothetical protein